MLPAALFALAILTAFGGLFLTVVPLVAWVIAALRLRGMPLREVPRGFLALATAATILGPLIAIYSRQLIGLT